MKTFVIAKVFVVNEAGELLTLRRSKDDSRRPGELDFPGGWVDEGEGVAAAAIRETQEEAGLTIANPRLVFGLSDVTEHGSGTWIVFTAHVSGQPEVTLSVEHDMFAWMKPEELLEKLQYERQRKMLAYVIDNNLIADDNAGHRV